MLDDVSKRTRGAAELGDLIETEIRRIAAYAQFVIEATPYKDKTLRVFPSLAHMPSSRVMRALERACVARGMDLRWDSGTRTCVLRIHAPAVGKERK